MPNTYNTIIIGAGAAGLFCCVHASGTGGKTLVIDHGDKPAEKIRISGGGRCNFTNLNCSAETFISQNRHFVKSSLSQYTQHDFIQLVDSHKIDWHEKTLGQLFCDGKSQQIIDLLLNELEKSGGELLLGHTVDEISKQETGFKLQINAQDYQCHNLVVATGGKSIPKMGASGFGYEVAEKFGLQLVEPKPALVPLTFDQKFLQSTADLTGVSLPIRISVKSADFSEALLFTHRGLSGPAVLQISSYWQEGENITIDLLPDMRILQKLEEARKSSGKKSVHTILQRHLPASLSNFIVSNLSLRGTLGDQNNETLNKLSGNIHNWQIVPAGTEGYRTAEVTIGGVSTDELSSRTMQSKAVPGLYFIGEVVDVTGWLGGYNFQWAWSSAYAAGNHIAHNR